MAHFVLVLFRCQLPSCRCLISQGSQATTVGVSFPEHGPERRKLGQAMAIAMDVHSSVDHWPHWPWGLDGHHGSSLHLFVIEAISDLRLERKIGDEVLKELREAIAWNTACRRISTQEAPTDS